jgi:hypothetical protein
VWGSAIRLDPVAGDTIMIGEGVETNAVAGALLELPAWSAISAGNLGRGERLPPEMLTVIIAVDRDPADERAACEAWTRGRREGRSIKLMWPDTAGADASDLLLREKCNAP